jgi:hypothetical protein
VWCAGAALVIEQGFGVTCGQTLAGRYRGVVSFSVMTSSTSTPFVAFNQSIARSNLQVTGYAYSRIKSEEGTYMLSDTAFSGGVLITLVATLVAIAVRPSRRMMMM